MVNADNKKPVRPWWPILTLLTQGIAPDYSGAAFPGLTKPVIFKLRIPHSGVNEGKGRAGKNEAQSHLIGLLPTFRYRLALKIIPHLTRFDA